MKIVALHKRRSGAEFRSEPRLFLKRFVDEWISLKRKLSTSLTDVHFTRDELLRSMPRPATRDQHRVERGEGLFAHSLIDHYFILSTKVMGYLSVSAGAYRSIFKGGPKD
jgi:hypothetical protein